MVRSFLDNTQLISNTATCLGGRFFWLKKGVVAWSRADFTLVGEELDWHDIGMTTIRGHLGHWTFHRAYSTGTLGPMDLASGLLYPNTTTDGNSSEATAPSLARHLSPSTTNLELRVG